MKEKRTGRTSARTGTDWNRVRALSDHEVSQSVRNDPDAHRTDAAFWKTAHVVMPQPKQSITIRLDADLLAWLRSQKGYQTRINAVLRSFMEANRRETLR